MFGIDNLYYYLFIWFKKRQRIFKNSDPGERVSYSIGIILVIWLITFASTIEFLFTKSFISNIPVLFYVISGLFFMWLMDYIYVKKNRYEKILKTKKPFSEKAGVTLSIIFLFISLIVPMVIFIVLHKIAK